MTDDSEETTPKPKGRNAKPAKPVVVKTKPVVVKSKPTKTGVTLRKKDFVDRAAEKSGVRKSDARNAIDAALTVLSDALAAGDEVVLPPLGKLRVLREKDNGKARIMTLRLQIIPETDPDSGTDSGADSGADKDALADTKD